MFFPAVVPPPHRSPTLTTRPPPPSSVLRSPIQVQAARLEDVHPVPSSSKLDPEELERWRRLCGLDVQEEEQEQELPEESDDESDYDDSKPYAALVNSPSPPSSPVRPTSDERALKRKRREEWQSTLSCESERERQLRSALESAITALQDLSRINTELQSTHQDLHANLKIARSNLALAEANTEMLEESIKRGDAFSGRSPSALGLQHKRVSSTTTQVKPGFWNRFKDSPSPIVESSNATTAASPRSPTQAIQGGVQLQRSSSYSTLPSPTAPTTAAAHAKAITALTTELGELKKSKAALEDELETLSQALFEEANKMVADERKKLAEKEEEVREAREERDALRRTIQVLGGAATSELAPESIPLPPPTPPLRESTPPLPNPWAAESLKPSALVIPPVDQRLPSLDRPRTPAEDLDGLIRQMEGEYAK